MVVYVIIGSVHFNFFNFFVERQYNSFRDVLTLNSTDITTILRFIGQMLAAATAFSIFGMRPKAGMRTDDDFSSSADDFILMLARSAKFVVAGGET